MFGQKRFESINQLLNQRFQEKKVLIAVHRGVWGGNIVGNTIASCALALEVGGDMFECDVVSSTDGVIYAFHDGTELRSLGCTKSIKTMSSKEINELTYRNSIGQDSGVHVEKLEHILQHFSHGELINIDRAWDIIPQVTELFESYPYVQQQTVLKSPVIDDVLEFLNECPHKYMFMPIAYSMEEVEKVLSYPDINTVGVEMIAYTEDQDLFLDDSISYLHSKNLYCWANVIKMGIKPTHKLYAGYDDDLALLDNPDKAWGFLFKKGIDVLQTDWAYQLAAYRNHHFNLASALVNYFCLNKTNI